MGNGELISRGNLGKRVIKVEFLEFGGLYGYDYDEVSEFEVFVFEI